MNMNYSLEPIMQRMEINSQRRGVAAWVTLTAGGIALGVPAYYATEAVNDANVADQLRVEQGAASSLLNDYDSAISMLPDTCQSVIKAAMKGSLDDPSAITMAANDEGSCKSSTDKIATLTYEYHNKLVPIENDIDRTKTIAAANTLGDTVAVGFGVLASLIGGLSGAVAGFGIVRRKIWERQRMESDLAKESLAKNTSIPELTTGNPGESKQPSVSTKYSAEHTEYANQNNMR